MFESAFGPIDNWASMSPEQFEEAVRKKQNEYIFKHMPVGSALHVDRCGTGLPVDQFYIKIEDIFRHGITDLKMYVVRIDHMAGSRPVCRYDILSEDDIRDFLKWTVRIEVPNE